MPDHARAAGELKSKIKIDYVIIIIEFPFKC